MELSSFNKQLNNKTSCNFPSFFFPQNKYFSISKQEILWVGLVMVVPVYFHQTVFRSSNSYQPFVMFVSLSHPFLLWTFSVSHLSLSGSVGFPHPL